MITARRPPKKGIWAVVLALTSGFSIDLRHEKQARRRMPSSATTPKAT